MDARDRRIGNLGYWRARNLKISGPMANKNVLLPYGPSTEAGEVGLGSSLAQVQERPVEVE